MKAARSGYNRLDALHFWQAVNMARIRSDAPDLSARQMAILTAVYLDEQPHTVKSLAAMLGVTKAVVTRALDTLSKYKMVRRCADLRDKRSITVGRTALGARYLAEFADMICGEMPTPKPVQTTIVNKPVVVPMSVAR